MYKVDAIEIRGMWPSVRTGLEVIQRRTQPDWIPEDIYCALRNNTAFLYAKWPAFVVIQVLLAASGRTELFIWAAFGVGELDENHEGVEDIARDLDCQSITFFSPRKGWAKNKLGYEEVHTLYRKYLT